MAYSAALGETDPRYFDTGAKGGVIAHPLFPVCYESPASQRARRIPELAPYFPRLVHAEHDLTLHRPLRQGDRVKTATRIVCVEARKPGAFVVFRMETRDARGEPISTTDFGALYRGVEVEGAPRHLEEKKKSVAEKPLVPVASISIPANLAHVYTECARIWNPIHTDLAHAREAGLPDIILHGTATLALSVSRVLQAYETDSLRARRIRCRFSGMVFMPSILRVYGAPRRDGFAFETRKADGEVVISRGYIDLDG